MIFELGNFKMGVLSNSNLETWGSDSQHDTPLLFLEADDLEKLTH